MKVLSTQGLCQKYFYWNQIQDQRNSHCLNLVQDGFSACSSLQAQQLGAALAEAREPQGSPTGGPGISHPAVYLEFQKPPRPSSLEPQGSSCTSTHGVLPGLTPVHWPSLPSETSRLPGVSSASRTHHPLANEGKGRGNSLAHCLPCTDTSGSSEEPRRPQLP